MTDQFLKALGTFVMVLLTIVVIAVLMAFPTMWLWNYLMPVLFGLIKIHVGQALCINIFSGLLLRASTRYEIKK